MNMDERSEGRVHFLDSLRGFTLVHMILFHLCYDLVFFLGMDLPWYEGWPGELWGSCIRWSFILISGMVFSKGRHPYRRGAILMGWGCVLTLVTWIAVPEALIRFGVLSFLGAASLIGAAVYPYLKRIPASYGFFGSAVLLAVMWPIPRGGLGFGDRILWGLPEALYGTRVLYWLGFPDKDFYSTDYFSILPWIFLFFMGIYLAEMFRAGGARWASTGWMKRIRRWRPGIVAFFGRHSLYIYLAHQPVIYGLCLLWSQKI